MKNYNFEALQKLAKSDSFVTDSAQHAQLCQSTSGTGTVNGSGQYR
jgi:hypothetical protein